MAGKVLIEARRRGGEMVYVPGLHTPIPGLAITEMVPGDDRGPGVVLTHIPTGFLVGIFDSAEQAAGCALDLSDIDWPAIENKPRGFYGDIEERARETVRKWKGTR